MHFLGAGSVLRDRPDRTSDVDPALAVERVRSRSPEIVGRLLDASFDLAGVAADGGDEQRRGSGHMRSGHAGALKAEDEVRRRATLWNHEAGLAACGPDVR